MLTVTDPESSEHFKTTSFQKVNFSSKSLTPSFKSFIAVIIKRVKTSKILQ